MGNIKTLLMGSTMLLSPVQHAQAQLNKAQAQIEKIAITEFKKADIAPVDMYISQKELSKYAGNNNVKLSNFDTNSDSKLNIDEFKQFLFGNKKSNNTAATQQPKPAQAVNAKPATANKPVQKVKTPGQLMQEATNIIKSVDYYCSKDPKSAGRIKKFIKEGWSLLLFGDYKVYAYQFHDGKIYDNIKKINTDNLKYIVNRKSLSSIYYSAEHNGYGLGYYRNNKEVLSGKNVYSNKICTHLGNVLDAYATKHKMHNEELNRMIYSIKGGDPTNLDNVVKYMNIK